MYDEEKGTSRRLRVCEVCNETGDDIVPCRACGIKFCGECGYPEKNLCFDCGDEVDESQEDEVDETVEESQEKE